MLHDDAGLFSLCITADYNEAGWLRRFVLGTHLLLLIFARCGCLIEFPACSSWWLLLIEETEQDVR